jgi:hypothetical protein
VKPVIRETKVEVEQQQPQVEQPQVEQPQVKVQINVQGQGPNEVEGNTQDDVKEVVVEEKINTGGKSKRRRRIIKNRTRKVKK